MTKMHVIYVPGLGDTRTYAQKLAVYVWRIYGVKPHIIPMRWAVGREFAPKFQRLLDAIDIYYETSGLPVGLVGASAGASAVLQAYEARKHKVASVVCLSGKILHRETIHPNTYKNNPAFKQSMENLESSLSHLNESDRAKILSVYSSKDELVPPDDSKLSGAQWRQDGRLGHGLSIAKQLTVAARANMKFLKQFSS